MKHYLVVLGCESVFVQTKIIASDFEQAVGMAIEARERFAGWLCLELLIHTVKEIPPDAVLPFV